MGVIFDTSVLITLERGSINLASLVHGRATEPYGICVMTASELLHGIHRANTEKRRLKREAYVEKVIEAFPAYPFDMSAARIHARIWARLAKKGITVGAHDLIIGATALSLGFSIVTSNTRDYGRIDGLIVESF